MSDSLSTLCARLAELIERQARNALAEDLSADAQHADPTQDLTSRLIPAERQATARLICREAGVLCGSAWLEAVFRQLDPAIQVHWRHEDGDRLDANATLCEICGPARALLTGERAALNLVQTLSATATLTRQYVEYIRHTQARILDTRKTLPGLRQAQKYAVRCGGGDNHRMGLWDAILIKENHIAACGSIAAAVAASRQHASSAAWIEVEVENLDEMQQALNAGADRIMLDNFSLDALREAVAANRQHARPSRLEASGGVNLNTLAAIAETGVDDISVGALSKDIHALDLSFRLLP